MTFFSKAKYRFEPIKEDKTIDTVPFLHACREIVPFFGTYSISIFNILAKTKKLLFVLFAGRLQDSDSHNIQYILKNTELNVRLISILICYSILAIGKYTF